MERVMMVGNLISYDLAVVPIFVNAGAALLPAMAAGIATFFALLFKPKAMLKACKEKPLVPTVILLVIAGIWAIFHFWPTADAATTSGRGGAIAASAGGAPSGVYIDWTEIALARVKAKARDDRQASAPATEPVATVASAVASEEPMIFRGNALRLGAVGAAPTGELGLAWYYFPSWVDDDGSVVKESDAMILSSPAVYGDRVYAGSCLLDPPDSYGIIFCVDAISGDTIWSVDQINGEEIKGFFSSPAVTADGRYVIIGQGLHPDFNCELICIDTQTGEVHWTVETPLHLESSPAIADGVVYIGAGAIEDPSTKKPVSHTGYVMAVNIADGQELWQYDLADPESSPVVQDGVLYIGSGMNGQAVVALRTETDEALDAAGQSRLIWRTDTPYPIPGAVTLLNDTVIIGGGNGDFVYRDPNPAGVVMMLDAKTGDIIWQTDMKDAVLGAVAAGKYLVAPVASGEVVALDPKTGDKLWSTSTSGLTPVLAAASIADDNVYAVSSDGYMAKLSLETGEILDRVYINDKARPGEQGLCISSPMIYNGRLYVGSETGGLRCYDGN